VIRFVEIPLGHGSPCSCVRCAPKAESRFDSAEVIGARVADAVATWSDGPGPNVHFTGPEPFSHPELPALITAAAGLGIERIGLTTDAGALSVPGNAQGGLATGVRHLQVVMRAGSADTHDALCGRSGLFDAAVAGVSAFVAAAHASQFTAVVTGLVPVCAHNVPEVPAAVAALARCGAVSVKIAVSPEARTVRGFAGWAAAAVDTGLVNGVWVHFSGVDSADVPVSPLHGLSPFALGGVAL